MGWFLVKTFVDLLSVYYLHIISRQHSNMLLLITIQKTKTCHINFHIYQVPPAEFSFAVT